MVAALALVGASCGGDDDATDDAGAADTSSEDADSGDNDDAGNDDAGNDEWCDLVESAEFDTPQLDDLDINDPESVENAFQEVVDLMEEAADRAPDEIEDDVELLVDQAKTFFEALKDADFNFLDVDQAALENTEADAASDRIDEFCGFDSDDATSDTGDGATDDTGDTGGDLSGEGTVRDELLRQFTAMGMSEDQANCLVDNLDMDEVVANGANDPSMFLDLFETCDINLAELQPPGG